MRVILHGASPLLALFLTRFPPFLPIAIFAKRDEEGGYKVVILYIWCPTGIVAFEDESGVSRSYNDVNFIFIQVHPVVFTTI